MYNDILIKQEIIYFFYKYLFFIFVPYNLNHNMLKKKQFQLFFFLFPIIGLVYNLVYSYPSEVFTSSSKQQISLSKHISKKTFETKIANNNDDDNDNVYEEFELENEIDDSFNFESLYKLSFNLSKETKKCTSFKTRSLLSNFKIPFYKLFCKWKFHLS